VTSHIEPLAAQARRMGDELHRVDHNPRMAMGWSHGRRARLTPVISNMT